MKAFVAALLLISILLSTVNANCKNAAYKELPEDCRNCMAGTFPAIMFRNGQNL